jgi:pimeloyl-ACP methyl ester carboxylesterase
LWQLSLVLAAVAAGAVSCRSQSRWTEDDGGVTHWIDVAGGRLKTRVYTGTSLSTSVVLVIVLHGDLPEPPPSYQYEFAKVLATASGNGDLVAAGVLRPGYRDPTGDRSSGDMGRAVADNYTPEVVDAVAVAVRDLSTAHHPRAVILVGHSGGAAIVANVLGRHPGIVAGAVLVGCGCDPAAWRARRRMETGNPMFDGPSRSLQPLSLARDVASGTIVRLVVGQNDDVAPPAYSEAYATALRGRGIDVSVDVVPGLGHNILFAPRVVDAVNDVVTILRRENAQGSPKSGG